MSEKISNSQLALILAPMENDGELAVQVLLMAGIQAIACSSIKELCQGIKNGCGMAVITEEALTSETIGELQEILDAQEPWSDLPILLLTNADMIRATQLFAKTGNISLLERPFSQLTLIRSVEVALKARTKQYLMRDLLLELKGSKETAERANLAKSEFLANMSHEIRTPIGAIMGFLELFNSTEGDDEEKATYIEIVERNSKHLMRLIDDILDLSKVEAGKMSVENLKFKLGDFLADLVSSMTFKAEEKGLLFNFSLNSKIPDEIITDPVRLRQIVNNLLGNAIKFTEKGSVELLVSYAKSRLIFEVRDTGIGLSPEQTTKLFKPFAQADTSTTRRFGGTGLGLVLSKKLAQLLGGDVQLKSSTKGLGTVFIAEIEPEIPSDSQALLEKPEIINAAGLKSPLGFSHALHGLKVLLVEDSPDNQVLISTYLQRSGALVSITANGEEGVETALEGNHDVILMDVQMPVMDGHQAVQKLRRSKYDKPIIALTAHAMSEEKEKCLASGFSDFLTKPIQGEVLIETLKNYGKKTFSETFLQ